MNKTNYQKVLDQIESNLACWNQSQWHCGTSHCFFGWAQILSGEPANDARVIRDARIYLNVSRATASYLSNADRTLLELKKFLIDDSDGYNRAGYNRADYNRAGYDSDGLDKNNKPAKK